MSKIPCGGFELDKNFLGMNKNGELSLASGSEGAPYQQLVTDGNGNTQWEDRLAYDGSRLVAYDAQDMRIVKVSDEVPSWATIDVAMKVWLSDGRNDTLTTEHNQDLGNGSLWVSDCAIFIATDNVEFAGIVFPEKGVYFCDYPEDGYYTTGIASAESDTPEITWDGNIETVKKLDEKFLPIMDSIVLNSSTTDSTKKFRITVDDSGAISTTEVTT